MSRPTTLIVFQVCLLLACSRVGAQSPTYEQAYDKLLGGQMSVEVLNMLFTHGIDEDVALRERIGRGITVGHSHMKGEVTVEVAPNPSRAELRFRLTGNIQVPNAVSYQGPVVAHGSMKSWVNATKIVYMDRFGITSRRAGVNCRTNMQIRNISAERNIVERIARRRARTTHAEMQQEANNKTRQQIAQRLDKRIQAAMDGLDERMRDSLGFDENEQLRLPDGLTFNSTKRHIQFWANRAFGENLTPVRREIRLEPANDFQFVLNDQLANEFFGQQWAGKRMSDEEVLSLIKRFRGTAPPALWVHERRPGWAIQHADQRPIEIEFLDSGVRVALNLQAVEMGSETFHAPIRVSTTVAVDVTPDGPRLTRLAPIVVNVGESPSVGGDTAKQIERLLLVKYEAFMPEESYFDAMHPPKGGSWDAVRTLKIVQLATSDGWLDFAMRFASNEDALAEKPKSKSR